MLWLQSQMRFDEIAEFDADQMTLNKSSKSNLGNAAPSKYGGFFYEFHGGFLVLYHDVKKIYFVVDNRTYVLDDHTIVEVTGNENNRKLEVLCDGKVLYVTHYIPNYGDKIDDDPTPFIDDEDFDFGLFVSNISKNPDRKNVLING